MRLKTLTHQQTTVECSDWLDKSQENVIILHFSFILLKCVSVAGLIELRGGTAGIKENKTSMFASRGFVTLNLAYIPPGDSGVLPPHLELENFEEAAEWLCKHPKVLPGGIGLHGNCLGSWIALLLAGFRSDIIKAVVSVSSLTFSSLSSYKYQGKVSAKLPSDHSKLIMTEDGVVVRFSFSTETEDNGSDSTYSAIIPCESISCPVLLIYGADDLFLNGEFNAKQVYDRMSKNGKGHLCSILRYPGAGHLIEPPYTPLCYSSLDPVARESYGNPCMVWGGEVEAHARAQEDAWPKVLAFLQKNIVQSIN